MSNRQPQRVGNIFQNPVHSFISQAMILLAFHEFICNLDAQTFGREQSN